MNEAKSVLVIDDDQTIRTMVGEVLEKAGYSLMTAASGLDGLKLLNDQSPRMIILDVNMPEMDGMQTCRMIRAIDKHRHTPVLMLTSRGDITDMIEARKMGADDYLVKPVEPSLLLKKVERLFSR